MLTTHADVLAKLRAEVLATVGPTRAPTPDDFREMKYLRAVLNGAFRSFTGALLIGAKPEPETLRMYPPVCVFSPPHAISVLII
jgi:hypothetical protein